MREMGEEYWNNWFFDDASTDNEEIRIKWRVVEIVKVREHGTFGKLISAERVEAAEVERRPHIFTYPLTGEKKK